MSNLAYDISFPPPPFPFPCVLVDPLRERTYLLIQFSQQYFHRFNQGLVVSLGLQQETQLHVVFPIQIQVLGRFDKTQKQGDLILLLLQGLNFFPVGKAAYKVSPRAYLGRTCQTPFLLGKQCTRNPEPRGLPWSDTPDSFPAKGVSEGHLSPEQWKGSAQAVGPGLELGSPATQFTATSTALPFSEGHFFPREQFAVVPVETQ